MTSKIYRHQRELFEADKHRIDNRIVNFSKPHVRPIIRGKAGKKTEFGAKISISDDNGFAGWTELAGITIMSLMIWLDVLNRTKRSVLIVQKEYVQIESIPLTKTSSSASREIFGSVVAGEVAMQFQGTRVQRSRTCSRLI